MATRRTRKEAPRPLEALGIDYMEESAYRILLAHRMATTEDVANALSLSPRKAQKLLDGIQAKGLASHSPERPRRYTAASPEVAVEALISQRMTVIERARLAIPELKEQVATMAGAQESEQMIEVITSRAALKQILIQLRQTAQIEIVGFQRAPVVVPRSEYEPATPKARVRSISDTGFLAVPGALEMVRIDMESGEEARVFPTLPIKMFVVDRRIGLVPLNVEDPDSPVMLVRASSLLDALYALFELTWERSTPIAFSQAGLMKEPDVDERVSDVGEKVIALLSAGLNDKAVAYESGMSSATLNRRIAELMKSFDTRTRFQLGWRAALEAFPERMAVNARDKQSTRPI
jgi:sugar-specific transcriptional regulator TrmB